MNRRTIFIFIVSLASAFIVGVGLYNLLLPLLNSIFPAVTTDSYNRQVHVMPVGNMLWSLVLSIAAGGLVLTFISKKLKKSYSK